MKSVWLFLAMLAPAVLRADLVLELTNHRHAIVYRNEERVFWELCGEARAARGCSQSQADQYFSTEHDAYVRSVQSFYGLIDRYYGGVEGRARLDADLTALQHQLDQGSLNVAELKRAEGELLALSQRRDQSDRAEREVLQYLEKGNDAIVNQTYQGQRYLLIDQSFFPVVYVTQRKTIYVVSQPVTFEQKDVACADYGKAWSPVTDSGELDGAVFAALHQSMAVTPGQHFAVWTGGASEGYYRRYIYNYYGELVETQSHSIQDWHHYSNIYTTSPNVRRVEYVPARANVVDLAAEPNERLRSVAVEASEGVSTDARHPVVCQRAFDFSDNDEAAYLNGEHFATFSLYDLEPSLERMAKSVYVNRADFFRQVAKVLAKYPLRETDDLKLGYRNAGARLFVLLAIEPLLHDIQSRFVDNYVLPDYNRAKDEWKKRLGVQSLSDVEMFEPTYRVALELVRGGLQASTPYLNAADKQAVEALIPVLGRGIAGGTASLAETAAALGKNRALFEHLTAARRAHGFGVMATAIADYLQTRGGR